MTTPGQPDSRSLPSVEDRAPSEDPSPTQAPGTRSEANGDSAAARGSPLTWSNPALRILMAVQVAIFLVVAATFLWMVYGPGSAEKAKPAALSTEQLKALAVAADQQGYRASAAEAWERYLNEVPQDADRAEILFHVGLLRLDAEQFDLASQAFLRARLADAGQEEFQHKIDDVLVLCRQLSGETGEIARLLGVMRIRGVVTPKNSPLLATLGKLPITEADLNEMLGIWAGPLSALADSRGQPASPNERTRTPEGRASVLNAILRDELFLRQARELKLDRDVAYREACRRAGNAILIQRYLERMVAVQPPSAQEIEAFSKQQAKPGADSVSSTAARQAAGDELLRQRREAAVEKLYRMLLERYGVKFLPGTAGAKVPPAGPQAVPTTSPAQAPQPVAEAAAKPPLPAAAPAASPPSAKPVP